MKLKSIYYATCIALISFGSCKKKTTLNTGSTNKQAISMLINGVLYSVKTGDSGVAQADAHIVSSNNRFQLDATSGLKDFSINAQNAALNTTTTISNNGALNFAQWEDGKTIFSTIGNSKGRLIFNLTKKVEASFGSSLVEGTFSGTLYNVAKTDSAVITNGEIKIIQ